MPGLIHTFTDYLQSLSDRGQTHIYLDDQARATLRQLVMKIRSRAQPAESRPPRVAMAATRTAAPVTPPRSADLHDQLPSTSGGDKTVLLDALKARAEKWQAARDLGTLRQTMVFSVGNPNARLMLVGEAPGHEEERKGEPFVGPAGQKLNDILKAMGVAREDVYISNIVKYRPATARQTTNNRKPTPEEMACCMPFIRREIEIVAPACIVALGGTAAEGLLGLTGTVSSMRGSWHDLDGTPVRVSYHPSYLLQSGANNDIKRKLWEDMLAVMELLAMPISEKQRAYFLPKA